MQGIRRNVFSRLDVKLRNVQALLKHSKASSYAMSTILCRALQLYIRLEALNPAFPLNNLDDLSQTTWVQRMPPSN